MKKNELVTSKRMILVHFGSSKKNEKRMKKEFGSFWFIGKRMKKNEKKLYREIIF